MGCGESGCRVTPHPEGFIRLRRAKRAAWWHSANRTDDQAAKTVTPVWCPACERWHLSAATTETEEK